MIGFWFVLQVFSASVVWLSGVSTGIAYLAHIGGFLAGLLFILPLWIKLRKRARSISFEYRSYYY
jgi:membrane associated rhomboid family serine protease